MDVRSKHIWKGKLPRVSFVIPAYNSQKSINETIDSIYSQDYKGKIEIIVYVSGDLKGYNFFKYKKDFVFMKGKGKIEKAIGVNLVAVRTKGDFVFVVDSDTVLARDCLSKVIARFDEKDVGAVTAIRLTKNNGFWSVLQILNML